MGPQPQYQLYNDKKKNARELLGELFTTFGSRLFGYAKKRWTLEDDAIWDLVYKTLFKLIEVRDKYTFESAEKFQGFVFSVFINYLKNYFRDHQSNPIVQTTDFNNENQQQIPVEKEENVTENKSLKALVEVLETLEDWQRILVLMRSDGYSYAEIARYVNKPENQLKVYYQRIKEQISRKIHGE